MSEETTQVEEKKRYNCWFVQRIKKNNRAGRKYDSSRIVKISYCFRR